MARIMRGASAIPPSPALLERARAIAESRRKAAEADAAVAPRVASVPQTGPLAALRPRRKLLLVESERAFGAVLSGWLGGLADADVIQATTLHNARAVLKSNRVDLVIAAVEMPDGNGLDLLKEGSLARVPRMFLSMAAPGERQKLEAVSGASILEKPLSLSALREQVWTLLPSTMPNRPPPPSRPPAQPKSVAAPASLPGAKSVAAPKGATAEAKPAAPASLPGAKSVAAPKVATAEAKPLAPKAPEPKSVAAPKVATGEAQRVGPPRPPAGMVRVAPSPPPVPEVSREATPSTEVAWPATIPPDAPSFSGGDGPRTIPFGFAATTPAAESFDELWEMARELLTEQDYARAVPLLRRADALRPGEDRVAKALRRLRTMGYGG